MPGVRRTGGFEAAQLRRQPFAFGVWAQRKGARSTLSRALSVSRLCDGRSIFVNGESQKKRERVFAAECSTDRRQKIQYQCE
jgi:hypothetical protein